MREGLSRDSAVNSRASSSLGSGSASKSGRESALSSCGGVSRGAALAAVSMAAVSSGPLGTLPGATLLLMALLATAGSSLAAAPSLTWASAGCASWVAPVLAVPATALCALSA
eukprot:6475907-Amphidinium_carterae.1